MKKVFLLLVLVIITLSCQNNTEKPKAKSSDKASKFYLQSQPNKLTGINFKNTVNETTTLNYLKYESIYNGAGVAIGDINNDGLPDIYFAGNSSDDKLYLNKGDFEFEDIQPDILFKLYAIKHYCLALLNFLGYFSMVLFIFCELRNPVSICWKAFWIFF